jgi:hypothetical protein
MSVLEEIFGSSVNFVIDLLPIEVLIIVVIMFVLHKTGSLERMAKTTNLWLKSHINADNARKQFRQELEMIETGQDAKLETLQVEARLQSQATYALENQRFRQDLFELTQAHISFLESEVTKNNNFLRHLVKQGRIDEHALKTSNKKPTKKN